MKKHFYIFRHGQTVWNAEGRPQGQHEYPVPLTVEGREQAMKLAEKLSGRKIKLIISSDLLRARQTGEIVSRVLQVPLEFDRRLREVDYGILNGLYTIEREEVYPDFKKSYQDVHIPFPEGESLHQVALRFIEAIRDICGKYSYRVIGLSSHGHAINALIEEVFGYAASRIENCEYIHITYDLKKDKFEGVELPAKAEIYVAPSVNY